MAVDVAHSIGHQRALEHSCVKRKLCCCVVQSPFCIVVSFDVLSLCLATEGLRRVP